MFLLDYLSLKINRTTQEGNDRFLLPTFFPAPTGMIEHPLDMAKA